MLTHVNKIMGIAICGLIMISCVACQKSKTTITALNKTFKNSKLQITATDVKAVHNEPGILDDVLGGGEIIIGVKLLVENISKESISFGTRSLPIHAYIGDLEAKQAIISPFGNYTDLMGNILPDKKKTGYYSVYATKDTEKIEVHIQTEYLSDKYVIFVLDIPSIADN